MSIEDRFIKSVGASASAEGTSLLSAGVRPVSLLETYGTSWIDSLAATALAKIYDIPDGNLDLLKGHLDEVVWTPPYHPAPFVGHMARPYTGKDLHINAVGFRDERESYATKSPETVRIFITGGSTAWGTGVWSQKQTISNHLEKILNDRVSGATGYRYEVVNAAFPAWSTTQEEILIERRITELHPDLIIMFSGNNDIHWAIQGRDINWFYSYMDENYMMLLNELYRSSGHPAWAFPSPSDSGPLDCISVARKTVANVESAAATAGRAGAQVMFALQPNIVSTAKRLSPYEQRAFDRQNKSAWESCYEAERKSLTKIPTKSARVVDLSRSFGELDAMTELFIDAYHFADRGNRIIAQTLADQIDWNMIAPKSVGTGQ